MAETVVYQTATLATPPNATPVTVDNCGADGMAQVVKLAVSADGIATHIPADATAGLKVDLGADNDVTVTGSVTANAGTNLNTSALALEAGGNLAAAAASLATLDNIVAGSEAQVDIVAALPAGTNNIGDVDVLTLPALPAGTNNIGDVDVLTVPAPLSTTGGGTEATALRVTLANDSTGVVSVDDNGGSLTVDGSVTANAGTNLNTSALALESGGNLAGAATSLAIMDDWDETDRAKVNPIAGQAGVQGASGVVTALTQRVVLATDVALPAGNNNIGDVDVASIAAGDNNIGNVDVVTLPALPAGSNNIGDVDVLTTPGPSYIASSALTQTSLDGLAASSTHVAGWQSAAIDNSTNRYKDYRINAVLRTEGAGVTAGECRMYLVAEINDTTWPDTVTGSEGTITFADTEERDAIARWAAVSANDTSTAVNVYLMCPSVAAVFNGCVPRKFAVIITQATGTTLETTGDPNQVYVAGVA